MGVLTPYFNFCVKKKLTSFEPLATVALHGRACYRSSFEKKVEDLRNAREIFSENTNHFTYYSTKLVSNCTSTRCKHIYFS